MCCSPLERAQTATASAPIAPRQCGVFREFCFLFPSWRQAMPACLSRMRSRQRASSRQTFQLVTPRPAHSHARPRACRTRRLQPHRPSCRTLLRRGDERRQRPASVERSDVRGVPPCGFQAPRRGTTRDQGSTRGWRRQGRTGGDRQGRPWPTIASGRQGRAPGQGPWSGALPGVMPCLLCNAACGH
jgi:hypothetical protein